MNIQRKGLTPLKPKRMEFFDEDICDFSLEIIQDEKENQNNSPIKISRRDELLQATKNSIQYKLESIKIKEITTEKTEEIRVEGTNFWKNSTTKEYFLKSKDPEISPLILSTQIFDYLMPHQREGLEWLWKLHQERDSGGILGDDMGLGKTIQVVSFVVSLFLCKKISRTLIVTPVSVIENWKKELKQWAEKKPRVREFYGSSKAQRNENLDKILECGGICLTTYGMILSNLDQLKGDKNFRWDYVILDEGHKIKNPSIKISQMIREIPSRHRLILTGTPVMNNLQEMWALFDYVCQGKLLGDSLSFKRTYQDVILRASDKKASLAEKKLGSQMASSLQSIISPYFLRREKKTVFPDRDILQTPKPHCYQPETPISKKKLGLSIETRKNDLIIWIKLVPQQLLLYRNFLESEEVKNVLNKTQSPLAAITVLKKICSHPLLLNSEMKTCHQLELVKK